MAIESEHARYKSYAVALVVVALGLGVVYFYTLQPSQTLTEDYCKSLLVQEEQSIISMQFEHTDYGMKINNSPELYFIRELKQSMPKLSVFFSFDENNVSTNCGILSYSNKALPNTTYMCSGNVTAVYLETENKGSHILAKSIVKYNETAEERIIFFRNTSILDEFLIGLNDVVLTRNSCEKLGE